MYPIYYDMDSVTSPGTPATKTALYNTGGFDLWSGGKNNANDNGTPGSDDITNW